MAFGFRIRATYTRLMKNAFHRTPSPPASAQKAAKLTPKGGARCSFTLCAGSRLCWLLRQEPLEKYTPFLRSVDIHSSPRIPRLQSSPTPFLSAHSLFLHSPRLHTFIFAMCQTAAIPPFFPPIETVTVLCGVSSFSPRAPPLTHTMLAFQRPVIPPAFFQPLLPRPPPPYIHPPSRRCPTFYTSFCEGFRRPTSPF